MTGIEWLLVRSNGDVMSRTVAPDKAQATQQFGTYPKTAYVVSAVSHRLGFRYNTPTVQRCVTCDKPNTEDHYSVCRTCRERASTYSRKRRSTGVCTGVCTGQ
jgi:hypothetical protein